MGLPFCPTAQHEPPRPLRVHPSTGGELAVLSSHSPPQEGCRPQTAGWFLSNRTVTKNSKTRTRVHTCFNSRTGSGLLGTSRHQYELADCDRYVSIPEPVQDYSERGTHNPLYDSVAAFQFPNRFRITRNSPYLNPLQRKGFK